MERIPYTTKSGLKIGCRYEPPRPMHYSRDMELLQSALLGSRRKMGHMPVTVLCLALVAGLCWIAK